MYFTQLVDELLSDGKLYSLNYYFDVDISPDKDEITMTRKSSKYTSIARIFIEGDKADFDTVYGTLHMTIDDEFGNQTSWYDPDDDNVGEMLERLVTNLTKHSK